MYVYVHVYVYVYVLLTDLYVEEVLDDKSKRRSQLLAANHLAPVDGRALQLEVEALPDALYGALQTASHALVLRLRCVVAPARQRPTLTLRTVRL